VENLFQGRMTRIRNALLDALVNVPRPGDAAPGADELPMWNRSLLDNIRALNKERLPLQPYMVVETIRNSGWILRPFVTIATSISATGLTAVDTIWYKPYASRFTEKANRSIVAGSRQKGMLVWVTDANTVLDFKQQTGGTLCQALWHQIHRC
jgi:hypothetical protein